MLTQMLTLGDVLALSKTAAADLDRLALPPGLRSAVRAAAAAEGVAPGRLVRMAVADFAETAAPDDWTALMSRLRDSPDPAAVCLQTMLERRLTPPRAAEVAEEHPSHARREN